MGVRGIGLLGFLGFTGLGIETNSGESSGKDTWTIKWNRRLGQGLLGLGTRVIVLGSFYRHVIRYLT